MPLVIVSSYLPPPVVGALRKVAEAEGIGVAVVVRRAVLAWLRTGCPTLDLEVGVAPWDLPRLVAAREAAHQTVIQTAIAHARAEKGLA